MTDFEFYSPTNIIFGRGVFTRIGEESLKYGKKALLLYGKESLKKNGLFDIIVKSLTDAEIRIVEHGGVEPNPVLPHALKGIEIAKRESVDFIVAAGGGSVIDEAKGIAAGVYSHGNLWDYYRKKAVVEKALPIIAVQTQPATSSETNQAGVLTNPETGEKFSIRSPCLFPERHFWIRQPHLQSRSSIRLMPVLILCPTFWRVTLLRLPPSLPFRMDLWKVW